MEAFYLTESKLIPVFLKAANRKSCLLRRINFVNGYAPTTGIIFDVAPIWSVATTTVIIYIFKIK